MPPQSGGGATYTLDVVGAIADVPAADWDACAGSDNPFLAHAFFAALEGSGSVTGKTGWGPRHVLLRDEAGRLVAAAPAYLKSHSYGEYVFDHGWAQAFERAGGHYYPKLQVSVPFTPVPGPRLLVRPGPGAEAAEAALIEGLKAVAKELRVSSLHVTFPVESQWRTLGEAGLLQRIGQQYHWTNAGYASFDDFLAALNSRKRKAIRKERREVAESGISVRALTGDEIEPRHWDAFYEFYTNTVDRKWAYAYLNRAFFRELGRTMADRVVLVVAEDRGEVVAGALNLKGTDTLYGRNWGSNGNYRFLHFEACYYQAIDYAIRHGLKRVEAGAQGQHKIQRGYLPTPTYSAHWIADPRFRKAVADFLDREREAVGEAIEELGEESPFRRVEAREGGQG